MKNLILVFFIFAAPGILADTFNVSSTPDFRAALASAAASGGDNTIILSPGTYSTQDDSLGAFEYISNKMGSLTLVGQQDGVVNLSGSGSTRILRLYPVSDMSKVAIRNIGFHDGYSDQNGGAIEVVSTYKIASFEISNCGFYNNSAELRGGAVYYWGMGLVVSQSEFRSNSAFGDGGGAIYATTISTTDSTFVGNYAQRGGAFSVFVSSEVVNNQFERNVAERDAGAIFWHTGSSHGEGVIKDNNFISNKAGLSGGAIAAENALWTLIAGNTFKDNLSSTGGAAVHFPSSPYMKITSNIFLRNEATESKAGLYVNHAGYGCCDRYYYLTNNLMNKSPVEVGYTVTGSAHIANNIFQNNVFDISMPTADSVLNLYNNYIDASRLGDMVIFSGENIFEGVNLGFEDPEYGIYFLDADSDLIDAGTIDAQLSALSNMDNAGSPRVIGSSVDIGPYEFYEGRGRERFFFDGFE